MKEFVLVQVIHALNVGFSFLEIEPRLLALIVLMGHVNFVRGLEQKLFSFKPCPVYLGKRLNKNAHGVKIEKNIWNVSNLNIKEALILFLI